MTDQPIRMSSGLPSTVLPEPDTAVIAQLVRAVDAVDVAAAVAEVVAAPPRSMGGWAVVGDHGRGG
ncbi:MAG: DUF3151 domain-containing protein, partial [Ilumatobacteraceae bacterium]